MRRSILLMMFLVGGILFGQDDPFTGKVFYQSEFIGFSEKVGVVVMFRGRVTFQSNGMYRREDVESADDPESSSYDEVAFSVKKIRGQWVFSSLRRNYWILQPLPGVFALYPFSEDAPFGSTYPLEKPTVVFVSKGAANVALTRSRMNP